MRYRNSVPATKLLSALRRTASLTGLAAVAVTGAAAQTSEAGSGIDRIVVTGTRTPEQLSKLASTVQVIDEEAIARSSALSVTDLLAEQGVAFFSEWTPGQTSITLRGARSDGQGRDFNSQVLVLLNGRRAGTANLSKLSPDHIARIEVARGPASVAYGSQALGGAINIITKSGRTSDGGTISVRGGSYDLFEASGGWAGDVGDRSSVYFGAAVEERGNWDGGKGAGEQLNTQADRNSFLGAISFDLADGHDLDFTVRRDSTEGAGFRGSSWDLDNIDNRKNTSADLVYGGTFDAWRTDLTAQLYVFEDVDELLWGAEASGVDEDNTERVLNAWGLRITPRVDLTDSTTLLAGFDYEETKLRSTRERVAVGGGPITQVSPFDNNQDETTIAGFAELAQSFLDDRLTLRGGWRHTTTEFQLRPTPNLVLLDTSTQEFEADTYSAGVTFRLLDDLNLRAGYATGFRAPNGSELAGEFTTVLNPDAITRGNPNLDPETSEQIEAGFTYAPGGLFLDVVVFDNTIFDRITNQIIDPRGPGSSDDISQRANAAGAARIQGVEVQSEYDLGDALNLSGHAIRVSANGVYNFKMQADGIDRNDFGPYGDKLQRQYEYQGTIGLEYDWAGLWGVNLTGTYNGPMYYDTEERLLNEANTSTVYKKDPYWVWGLRMRANPTESLEAFFGVNNIFDINEHAMFIALDEQPYISDPSRSNGGRGNSMPGRNVYAGFRISF